ncbi:MAG TPA: hypothetical protein PLU17_13150 [Chitinophagaceae bacterium]|nr:hypothetical protein [Chitinophagaceae bacterium]
MKASTFKATTYLCLLFSFVYSHVYSQSYIPTVVKGRSWDIIKPLGMGQFNNYSFKLACDTQINSMYYLKLITLLSNNFYVREDTMSHKIYMYDLVSNSDKLLIDYDISIGATAGGAIVDSVKTALLFGQMRKVIYFDNLVKWVEGVGSSFNGISDTFNGYTYVNKIEDGDSSCTPLNLNEVELDQIEIKHLGNYIEIIDKSGNYKTVKVFNYGGQTLLQKPIDRFATLDLSKYSNQLLFIEITSEKRKIVKRVFTQ